MSGDFALGIDELRVVARYVAQAAHELLPIFEDPHSHSKYSDCSALIGCTAWAEVECGVDGRHRFVVVGGAVGLG